MLFPQYCLMCEKALEKGEQCICLVCQHELPKTTYHLDVDNPLTRRFWGKVPIKFAWAYLKFSKQGKVQRVLHQLKYKNRPEIGKLFGQWYGAELKASNLHQEIDLILPVPLHLSKLKKRGYNQSDPFAEGLSQTMEVAWCANTLRKNAASETQTKKGRFERWENVQRLFTVTDPEKIKNQRILLVDDVITTGSTLEACAEVLIAAGCREVSIAAIASA